MLGKRGVTGKMDIGTHP